MSRPRPLAARFLTLVLLLPLFLAACEHNDPTSPSVLASITVTPNPQNIALGGTQTFIATGIDQRGNLMAITPVWSVVQGGGTIDASTGLFRAGLTAGTFANTIQATAGGMSGLATVTVTGPGPLASIVITPNPGGALVGSTIQFVAEGRDAAGTIVPISPTVTWSVVAGGGTINPTTGLFTAGPTSGTFTNTIRATSGGVSGTATVTLTDPAQLSMIVVTPNPGTVLAGGTIQFSAEGRNSLGAVVPITPAVTWSVVAGGGTINSTTGLFTAGATTGTFNGTVKATSGSLSGVATVMVTAPGQLASIVITPNPGAALVGGTIQFTAQGLDAAGAVVAISPAVAWSVVAGGGTINVTTGLFTAGTATGTFINTIRATSGGITGFATVTVTAPAPLATIVVTPNPGTALVGGTIQFSAEGRTATGSIIPITPAVTWSVVAGGGTINPTTGLFTAGATTGTYTNTVQATSGSISGFATVNVTASGQLASIEVTPNPGSAVIGGMITYSAVGRDAGGTIVTITPAVTWSVVAGGGTIDGVTGVFTAGASAGTFFNTVKATSGTVSGFATAIVTATAAPGPSLGTAQTYGILAGSTVTCVTGGTINASVAVSPGSTLTGFPPCTISGTTNLGDAVAATAKNDLTTAYNELAGLPCGTVVTPADLGGRTLAPGVYCAATSMSVTGTVTLDGQGDPNARFVFQIGSTLTTGTSANIALINGAMAKNVWFQVGSSATLGTGTTFRGNILALESITLNDNATMLGRALARNGAVTLGTNNTISLP
ncbi:MAG: ice-binding family protein [Gemmatimonadales bacterium]